MEDACSASPLSTLDLIDTVMGIVSEALGRDRHRLYTPIFVQIAIACDKLFEAEPIGLLTPAWDVIESDASVAIEFRNMLRRRKRWALEYDRHMGVMRRQLVSGIRDLVSALPDACFDAGSADEAPFTVPLASFIERPAEVIERLIVGAYTDDTFRYDLFHELRSWYGSNMITACGFPPGTNPADVQSRLYLPTRHKSENGPELSDLYLAGTPFADVLRVPIPFHVPESARFEHCHIVGGTGHGKTQLMQRMIHSDLVAAQSDGRSVVVIDSQGDLINKLVRLDLFAPDRPGSLFERLVLIDPSDVEYPASLNLFDAHLDRLSEYRLVDRERVLNGVVELYEGFFGDLLGAELTQKQGVIFRYLARLMLAIPNATIHTLMQLMEDGKPFKKYMDGLEGSARYFFATEFFHPSFSATKKQILKRLWGVLSTPAFERMFAQRDNKLDLFAATNAGKIILVNTAKDLLKTEGSQLFGRFFISLLAQAALERSTIPESERTPTFAFIDESQEYFDDTIETILSQARKYKMGITAAHQTLDQLSPRLRAAFLSNTSLKCAGGVSNKDARALAPELHTTPDFIEGMRRRGDATEFAVWLKHRTPSALTLSVPLGYLERKPTLTEEDYDALLDANRAEYCGTLADIPAFENFEDAAAPEPPQAKENKPAKLPEVVPVSPHPLATTVVPAPPTRPTAPRDLGKGGPKHRYLQKLVCELAEAQGFRATVEAPLPNGTGQVDILLTRSDRTVAVEISVTTPTEYERHNVRKCLDAGYAGVAVVLAKSARTSVRFISSISEGFSDEERSRVTFLTPENIPGFIESLVPPEPHERTVKGYKVRVSHTVVTSEEGELRRKALVRILSEPIDP